MTEESKESIDYAEALTGAVSGLHDAIHDAHVQHIKTWNDLPELIQEGTANVVHRHMMNMRDHATELKVKGLCVAAQEAREVARSYQLVLEMMGFEAGAKRCQRIEADEPPKLSYGRVCPHCGETVAMWHETWDGVTMEVTILALDEHGIADETEQGGCDGGSPGYLRCQGCGGEVSQEDWCELEVREVEGGQG